MHRTSSFCGRLCGLPVRLAAMIAIMGAIAASACAQRAAYTAERPYTVSAFGGVSRVSTDYNSNVTGFTLGADITRNYRFFRPSIEVRYTRSSGTPVGEDSLLGGIKLSKGFGRFHPYLEAMAGYGLINFPGSVIYPHDNSTVYDGGVGIDYDLLEGFAVKVDVHQQFWKVGTEANELEPVIANLGIVYTIPSGWGRGRHPDH